MLQAKQAWGDEIVVIDKVAIDITVKVFSAKAQQTGLTGEFVKGWLLTINMPISLNIDT